MPRLELDYAQIRQLPHAYTTTIPEEYLDAMGHMNVMWYTHLFSVGMGPLLQCTGLSWEKITDQDGGTFALESHIRYLSEVRVGQTIDIYSRIIGRTAKRYHVMQFMTNRDKQDVSATFEIVSAYVDLKVRRMAVMPEEVQQAFDQLIAEQSQLDWTAPLCGSMQP